MARRRELADVADGISGHFIFDSAANPDWPLAKVARAIRAGEGTAYSFDLIGGEAEPSSAHIRSVAEMLHRDLRRHLDARRLPRAWVSAASLDVRVAAQKPGQFASVRCQVRIVDDRGVAHTSTRHAGMRMPYFRVTLRLRRWLHGS